VQNVAHLRDHAEPTLVDLPVRILLASMGRAGGAIRLRSRRTSSGFAALERPQQRPRASELQQAPLKAFRLGEAGSIHP